MEEIEKILKAIQRTAEIVREHLEARFYRNHITTLGINGIITMAKEAIVLIEEAKKKA
jgi:predicted lipid carrier protein YhbT